MSDREKIEWLADRAGIVQGHGREQWIKAGIEILSEVREEGFQKGRQTERQNFFPLE